jgi:hypothetical protein
MRRGGPRALSIEPRRHPAVASSTLVSPSFVHTNLCTLLPATNQTSKCWRVVAVKLGHFSVDNRPPIRPQQRRPVRGENWNGSGIIVWTPHRAQNEQPYSDPENRFGLRCAHSGLTVIFTQSQPSGNRGSFRRLHAATLGRDPLRVNLNFNRLRQPVAPTTPRYNHGFGSYNSPTKDKVTLSFVRLLYGD